jgi:hypothetical protein
LRVSLGASFDGDDRVVDRVCLHIREALLKTGEAESAAAARRGDVIEYGTVDCLLAMIVLSMARGSHAPPTSSLTIMIERFGIWRSRKSIC